MKPALLPTMSFWSSVLFSFCGFGRGYILIIEENNKSRKTRVLFRKTGNIKGAFHPKMGTIKDKNGRDLADAEGVKKRWREYMEDIYKIDLNELDYKGGAVSHPEPDILE